MNLCPAVSLSQKLCVSPSPPHCAFLRPLPPLCVSQSPAGYWDNGTLGHRDAGTLGGVRVPTYCNRVVVFIVVKDYITKGVIGQAVMGGHFLVGCLERPNWGYPAKKSACYLWAPPPSHPPNQIGDCKLRPPPQKV